MKNKLFISMIVIFMLLIPSTIAIVGKQSDMPEQSIIKKSGENKQELQYLLFQEIALKMYEKKGWVPQGILEVLSDLGR